MLRKTWIAAAAALALATLPACGDDGPAEGSGNGATSGASTTSTSSSSAGTTSTSSGSGGGGGGGAGGHGDGGAGGHGGDGGAGGHGGDGGCGDGLLRGLEGCDDGGLDDGDGCSAACAIEAGYTCAGAPSTCSGLCGDGLLRGLEGCDDGGLDDDDGCSAVCAIEGGYDCTGEPSACGPLCGDGRLVGPEGCDDGNLGSGDGCATDCVAENGYACAGEPSTCVTTCGDGVQARTEGCDDGDTDDGDGCTAACALEAGWTCAGEPNACAPICGDGLPIGAEGCDDGNPDGGDGCSAACATEAGWTCTGAPSGCAFQLTPEVEPNDSFADADASPVQLDGLARIAGAIAAIGDRDAFRLQLAADAVVRFETFAGGGESCAVGMTTELRLYDAALAPIYTNVSDGIGFCSALVVPLAAGTYYVRVEENGNNAALASYVLEVRPQASHGGEAEPNDARGASTGIHGTDTVIAGGHLVETDVDFYALTIPAGGLSLRAETVEGGRETCESGGVDTILRVFNAAGSQLVSDDNNGRGLCSLLDGTGAPPIAPLDLPLRGLAAGVYYVAVEASPFAGDLASRQFDYRLALTLRR